MKIAKANSLISLGHELCARFDGEVPGRLADLVTLPGVGRKTANVVLGNAFDVPGITVERVLMDLFPQDNWTMLSHRLIWHGRRRCHARRPACGACPIARLCPAYGEGPTDPEIAERLVRDPAA